MLELDEKELKQINDLKCEKHKENPNAKYEGTDFTYTFCCDDFKDKILELHRELSLNRIRRVTREGLGF